MAKTDVTLSQEDAEKIIHVMNISRHAVKVVNPSLGAKLEEAMSLLVVEDASDPEPEPKATTSSEPGGKNTPSTPEEEPAPKAIQDS